MFQRLLLRLRLRLEELLKHPLPHVVARAGEEYPRANGHEGCEDDYANEPGAEAGCVGSVGHVGLDWGGLSRIRSWVVRGRVFRRTVVRSGNRR